MNRPFWRAEADALVLTVRVQPGAKADAVVGVADGVLRVRLRAPAIEGRANDALCAFIAERLDTTKSRVEILRGGGGRLKQLRVRGARRPVETAFSPGKTASRSKKTRFFPENT
ncbi:MAG: DUF167 domain-containing protein [Bacillota bacterium]